jgi:hypothetical protein
VQNVAKDRLDKEATGIMRVEVASALKEKTAQLETAYQNATNLLSEFVTVQVGLSVSSEAVRRRLRWQAMAVER